jgi:hypothetical protein
MMPLLHRTNPGSMDIEAAAQDAGMPAASDEEGAAHAVLHALTD